PATLTGSCAAWRSLPRRGDPRAHTHGDAGRSCPQPRAPAGTCELCPGAALTSLHLKAAWLVRAERGFPRALELGSYRRASVSSAVILLRQRVRPCHLCPSESPPARRDLARPIALPREEMATEQPVTPTEEQLEILEYNFCKVNKHPDPTTLCLIAAETGLSEEQTLKWFKQRLAEWRKSEGLPSESGSVRD
uniref:Homeodomain-only protein n=2 Tax=Apteryx TaxID=8821 RepID=A0A8B9S2U1_APTOW